MEIPAAGQEPVLRTYSVWSHTPSDSSLTLRVVLHDPGGPGSAWASAVATGDRLRLGTPGNRIALDLSAPYHVFVGEETGAVPLLTMLAALPASTEAYGVLETTGPGAELSAPTGSRALPWVHRGSESAAASKVLGQAVRELELPQRHGIAYVAGESATCRAVLRHLVSERGWPRYAVKVQAQWTPGKCGLV